MENGGDKQDHTTDSSSQESGIDAISGQMITDLSNEKLAILDPDTKSGNRYNPEEHADNSRKKIAYALVCTLILLILMLTICGLYEPSKIDVIKKLIEYIFNPLTTLIGTIVGFYFGKSK